MVNKDRKELSDINIADKFGKTPLYSAAKNGHKEIVEQLLEKDADPNIADKSGKTPLSSAAENGHKEIVEQLLEKDADPNIADKSGQTPLYRAAENGHKEIVEQLLEKDADPNIADKSGQTPLYRAAENEHKEIVEQLLEEDADPNIADKSGKTPLYSAAKNGHKEIVKQLLEKDADPNIADEFGKTPLYSAAKNGHKEIVEQLLEKGADPNITDEYGKTPLYGAAKHGHKEIVEQLLEKDADPNITDKFGKTPLYRAAENDHKEIVKQLLEKGADPNIADKSGQTPLYRAAENDHKEIVGQLLKKDADPNIADKSGQTPLYRAAANDHKEIVEQLLEKDADPNIADKSGKTPLLIAAQSGSDETVRYLVEHSEKYGVLINCVNAQGNTIMHYYNNNAFMQELLFKNGIIPNKQVKMKDVMNDIIQDNQSVHASEVTKRTNFFTKELVQNFGDNYNKLTKAAEHYKDNVKALFSINPKLAVKLLDLTDQEKRSVMENTLSSNGELPSDKDFVEIVVQQAFKVLDEQYLRKASDGKYDQGYPTVTMQYDWTTEQGREITIPESLGLISELASATKPNLSQMKELTATLLTKQQDKNKSEAHHYIESLRLISELASATKPNLSQMKELTATLLTKQQDKNKSEAHHYIESFNENEVKVLFKEISAGLDIEQVYEEQQKFKLAKQLYVAATTYGNNSSACTQGTWAQIITTAEEIDPKISDKWVAYQEAEKAKAMQYSDITSENIMPFLNALANKELLKKANEGGQILSNPNLKDALCDLAIVVLDINEPKNIDKGQQKVLSIVNAYFVEHIKEFLPNYNTDVVPTLEQYSIVIDNISMVPAMQKFTQNPNMYFIGDLPSVSRPSISTSNATPTSSPSNSTNRDVQAASMTAVERLNASRTRSKSPQPGTSRMGR